MAVVVNHLKTLGNMVGRERGFLESPDNHVAAGVVTTDDGSPVVAGGLYPPGALHHHVVTRRPTPGRGRTGRLVLATYATRVDAGVMRWQPIWRFDLGIQPDVAGRRPVRSPYRPLPAGDGRLASLSVALVSAVLGVAAGGPSDPDLRMTRAVCDVALVPGEDRAETLRKAIAYDSRPVLRLALQAANGEVLIPDCIAPEDVVVVAVKTGYQDRSEGSSPPRACVHFRGPTIGDVLVELPENCQLAPELVAVASGYTASEVLTIKAGTSFAWPLVRGRRTKWQQAKADLMDDGACRWLQYQAVTAAAAVDPDGLPPADTQRADPANKLFERVTGGADMVRACDYGYNPDRKLIDRGGLDGTSAVFDLWSLAGNSQHGHDRDQPGQTDLG